MPEVLVLGGSGFIGTVFTKFLLESGSAVTTVSRTQMAPQGHAHAHVVLDVWVQRAEVSRLIEQIQPVSIVNLAGGREDRVWDHAHRVYRLCWTVAEARTETRLLLIGSAAEYGLPLTLPVDETHPLRATSGYGLSRAIQSWIAAMMWEEHHLPVVVARLFNVIGPGQDDTFVAGTIVRQAVEMQSGARSYVSVGNVKAVRDLIDVRDAVRALAWLAMHGSPGEAYNVCSGRPTSIEELLQHVGALAGLADNFYRSVDERLRHDVPAVYGSNRKLSVESGWFPTLDLDRSLSDMIAFEMRSRRRQ